jgi:hypothetical protein
MKAALLFLTLVLVSCGPTPDECSKACHASGQVMLYSNSNTNQCFCGNPPPHPAASR